MMTDIAISVRNVSKRYQVFEDQQEFIINDLPPHIRASCTKRTFQVFRYE